MKTIEFQNELWDLFKALSLGIDDTFCQTVGTFGLTMIQARILIELKQHEECSIGTLSDAVGSAAANASTMCKKLEAKGLVDRIRDDHDERIVNVSLTEDGAKLLKDMEMEMRSKYDPVFAQYTADDYAIILAGIKKLKEIFADLREVSK